jgi:hypothetical protein
MSKTYFIEFRDRRNRKVIVEENPDWNTKGTSIEST